MNPLACSALVYVDAEAVGLGLLVALLAVAHRAVLHRPARPAPALDVLARVCALERVLVAGEVARAVVVAVAADLVAADVGVGGVAAVHRRARAERLVTDHL